MYPVRDIVRGVDPANMMYFGVLLNGCTRAAIADLDPKGVSGALLAMAFATLLVPASAWFIGTPASVMA